MESFESFHTSGTPEGQNGTHGVKVLGKRVWVASYSTQLRPVINYFLNDHQIRFKCSYTIYTHVYTYVPHRPGTRYIHPAIKNFIAMICTIVARTEKQTIVLLLANVSPVDIYRTL